MILIADSGIQFYTKRIKIKKKDKPIARQHYWQEQESKTVGGNLQKTFKLSLAYEIEPDVIIPMLFVVFDSQGNPLRNKINLQITPKVNAQELISIDRLNVDWLRKLAGKWMPVPFFKYIEQTGTFQFGAIGWSRMMINDIVECKVEKTIAFDINFAFDTVLSDNNKITLTSDDTQNAFNCFALCADDNQNIQFISSEKECSWVDEYLLSIVHQGQLPDNETPLEYLANYLYLIKFLSKLEDVNGKKMIDEVLVYPNDTSKSVDVDLVLDIGNSRTCGVLFESLPNSESNDFNSVKKLELINLSNPIKKSDEPFSMRLAFYKAQFGDFEVPGFPNLFAWGSVLRIGEEATQILSKYDIPNHILKEPANTLSSPKRYLWDANENDKPWEFVKLGKVRSTDIEDHVVVRYLSEQFTADGQLVENNTDSFGVEPRWSKKSLMTFVMIEIFNHALVQINAHNFRKKNSNHIAKSRRLRSVVITCPTSMTDKEQVNLRNSAKEALKALGNYKKEIKSSFTTANGGFFKTLITTNNDNQSTDFDNIQIIPNGKQLAKPLSEIEDRNDWIYDESSASQINFIYAELAKKYRGNFKKFFEIYGKKSTAESSKPDSITVASIDIGGGTTDLMVCNYSYSSDSKTNNLNITPDPLYWETFNTAGDDLVKSIINQLLIDGNGENQQSNRFCGIIRNYAKDIGCENVTNKILYFFGTQANLQGEEHNFYRKNFVHQILVPIAIKYLSLAVSSQQNFTDFQFEDAFPNNKPNSQLLKYINNHFGGEFQFENIRWYVSKEVINNVIKNKFSDLFKQIATIVFACKSDFLLLAGKPSELPEVRNIFVKELPLTPDRIISLSEYKIDTWYPFTNEKGYIKDAKTTVAVGAMIYALAGKYGNLSGFSLNTEKLKQKLHSTANYIGEYDSNGNLGTEYFFDKTKNDHDIKNAQLPIVLGFKQLDAVKYPARPIYKLDFNERNIAKRIKISNPILSKDDIRNRTDEILSVLRNAKYDIEISRDFTESKEAIKIESVENVSEGISANLSDFELKLMTAEQPDGYWLDTGEFKLLSQQD